VIESGVQLVDGVGAESIPHFGAVEGDPDHTGILGPVVCDIGEVEAGDLVPSRRVEYLRNHDARA
jgi:hypothetical protein